jgi:hypothetical protein
MENHTCWESVGFGKMQKVGKFAFSDLQNRSISRYVNADQDNLKGCNARANFVKHCVIRGHIQMTLRAIKELAVSILVPYLKMICVACALISVGAVANAEQWARKMFTETHHDFGTVSRNAKTEHSFTIENCFEEDVHIVAVRSSCGCTTPVLSKKTLKSWEKGELVAQFNTRSFIGTKSAEITLVIDKPYYAEVKLTVGGTIRSDIVVEPGEVKFGDVDAGTSKTIDMKISYAGRRDWKISDIRGDSQFLEVRLDPVQRQGSMIHYLLHIKLKDDAPVGEILDELVVVTNDEKNEIFTLPVSGKIVPPVSISPLFVAMGDVDEGKSSQQRLIVRARKPFAISGVDCPDNRFDFSVPEGTRTVHVIPFTFRGELLNAKDDGSLKQKILVRTSLGETMTAEATVAGRVIH